MTLWQNVLLSLISGCVGMLFSALILVWKYGPKITKLDFRMELVERGVERIELVLSKINLAELENRILERGDGRWSKVGYSDERFSIMKERLDRVEADIEQMRGH